ncbi:MAG: CDP-2,3-bis-(O-geranylgeranyl)-sn-glycerol synthase [Candidatus Aenigmarchaeota archaeon]|nr:CDP-2,3-bis-(O-geranylgeranyl)-sn-glycerol synthase [Candidatus Aenigmarchaeota archaeon]
MDIVLMVAQALWFIWPAYCANAFPVIVHGKKPIDGGKFFGKNRLLGSSKTVEGTIAGVSFGVFIGIIQIMVYNYIPKDIGLIEFSIPLIIVLSVGALMGDIVGSFIKRRFGMKPGDPAILLDQLDFLIMALILASPLYLPSAGKVLILIVLTPLIHLIMNIIGFMLKFKKKPW